MIFSSKIPAVLFILFLVLTISKQMLLNQVIAAYSVGKYSSSLNSESQLVTSIIPGDADEIRPYKWKGEDVTLKKYVATNGKQLVDMDKEIVDSSLTEDQKRRLAAFGKLSHPCCNALISTRDCLHAVAAMGLSKFLIKEGWSDEKIKKELFLWYRFWWPKNYVVAATYLRLQGTNPDSVSLDDWLGLRLSSVRSFQLMSSELNSDSK